MRAILGLGNPGGQYARHRHNVGFMALDRIAERAGIGPFRRRFQGEAAEGRLGQERVLLLKPTTFMNESGRAARAAMDFYKLQPSDIVVIYDELDLAPGKLRMKQGGGAAGHNGIRSMIKHCGPGFWRVRVGIGHPGMPQKVHSYVLHDFAKVDKPWLEPMLDAIGDNGDMLAELDHANFMNRVAMAMQAAGQG
jgi:peptidyl-tRNA hydrolase, PTH1 family